MIKMIFFQFIVVWENFLMRNIFYYESNFYELKINTYTNHPVIFLQKSESVTNFISLALITTRRESFTSYMCNICEERSEEASDTCIDAKNANKNVLELDECDQTWNDEKFSTFRATCNKMEKKSEREGSICTKLYVRIIDWRKVTKRGKRKMWMRKKR